MPKGKPNESHRPQRVFENVRLLRSTDVSGLFQIGVERRWVLWEHVLPGSVEWDGQRGALYLPPWYAKRLGFD